MTNGVVECLVTGGTGFLGRNVIRRLLEKHPKWRITVMDIQPPSDDIRKRIAEWRHADITSAESVRNAFQDYHPEIVMHSAGIVPARDLRYSTNKIQWEKVKAINYQGTINVLDATLESGCRKFVFTSSCTTVIDDLDHDYYNMNESIPLGKATLHYGKSKAMAEQYVLSPEHAAKGLKACALRPCTIIGPEDLAVISIIHDLIAKGETYFVVGDGHNLYDFVYIDNAVKAHILAMENLLTTETAAGQAFFISNQEPVYFWDFFLAIWAHFDHVPRFRIFIPLGLAWFVALLLEMITYCTGGAVTLDTGSVKDGVRTQYSDNSKAIEILGYRPDVGMSEGVRLWCEDYKKYLAKQSSGKHKFAKT
ncbi:hypothetical protein CERZMDRAFT_40479 [Cercospora zeae-maydis SCOH1-5]|uniref:3-beta hydroxysteroid dehydrogenase/isomerase domain-containing protein n=1 Tax=Cercospora zeae-maydis SCOH1-5 TaxID=717836 RepID=A0A6A6FHG0_9PEZI|nr:hypothetical protein CERZMDRAFT_40479 [Cercospora zeae-maydis SCOH1-5]